VYVGREREVFDREIASAPQETDSDARSTFVAVICTAVGGGITAARPAIRPSAALLASE
jgi:hypothetical protein